MIFGPCRRISQFGTYRYMDVNVTRCFGTNVPISAIFGIRTQERGTEILTGSNACDTRRSGPLCSTGARLLIVEGLEHGLSYPDLWGEIVQSIGAYKGFGQKLKYPATNNRQINFILPFHRSFAYPM